MRIWPPAGRSTLRQASTEGVGISGSNGLLGDRRLPIGNSIAAPELKTQAFVYCEGQAADGIGGGGGTSDMA